jgi:chorismate mutase
MTTQFHRGSANIYEFPARGRFAEKREELVFQNVLGNNRGPLSEGAIRRLFERIIDEMRTLQRDRMRGKEESGT